jgi:hypothetical protein
MEVVRRSCPRKSACAIHEEFLKNTVNGYLSKVELKQSIALY